MKPYSVLNSKYEKSIFISLCFPFNKSFFKFNASFDFYWICIFFANALNSTLCQGFGVSRIFLSYYFRAIPSITWMIDNKPFIKELDMSWIRYTINELFIVFNRMKAKRLKIKIHYKNILEISDKNWLKLFLNTCFSKLFLVIIIISPFFLFSKVYLLLSRRICFEKF